MLAEFGYGAPEYIILFLSNPINCSVAAELKRSHFFTHASFSHIPIQTRGEKRREKKSSLWHRGNSPLPQQHASEQRCEGLME